MQNIIDIIDDTNRTNLFSGFPIMSYQNQPAQLQRQARIVEFCLEQVLM